MRPLAFEGARVIDPATGHDGPATLVVRARRVEGLLAPGEPLPSGCERRDCRRLVLAPGLVDARVHAGAAAHGTMAALGEAALRGGVTTVIVQPDLGDAGDGTDRVADDPAALAHLTSGGEAGVRVAPVGALTMGLAGTALAPMASMRLAGAVAFGHAMRPIADAALLRAAMLTARDLGVPVDLAPLEPTLSAGVAAAGAWSSWLGHTGVPAEAEVIAVLRDGALARATGAALHVALVSSAATLSHLRRIKGEADVSAGVGVAHLTLNETDTGGHDPRFRLDPPLRTEDDRQALVAALGDGTIDVACSAHRSPTWQSRDLPFADAPPGTASLPVFLASLLRLHHSGDVPLARLIETVTLAPARRFALEGGTLAPGAPADLVLFDPDEPWVAPHTGSAFDGARMTGRVRETWVGGRLAFALHGDGD